MSFYGKLTHVACLFIAGASFAQAQIRITVEGVFTGYNFFTNGQSASFTYTLNPTGGWNLTAGNPVYSAITGSGLSGSYSTASQEYIDVAESYFELYIWNTANGALAPSGLIAPNEQEIAYIDLITYFSTPIFDSNDITSYQEGTISPTEFFGKYLGTYATLSGVLPMYSEIGNAEGSQNFTPTSVTIAAIPEPASAAAILGFAALGFTALRRKRRA